MRLWEPRGHKDRRGVARWEEKCPRQGPCRELDFTHWGPSPQPGSPWWCQDWPVWVLRRGGTRPLRQLPGPLSVLLEQVLFYSPKWCGPSQRVVHLWVTGARKLWGIEMRTFPLQVGLGLSTPSCLTGAFGAVPVGSVGKPRCSRQGRALSWPPASFCLPCSLSGPKWTWILETESQNTIISRPPRICCSSLFMF